MGYFVQLLGISCLALLMGRCMVQADDTMDIKNFTQSLEKFGTRLYLELAATNPGQNIVLSPFSIQTCAFMALLGAEGETANELRQGLNFDSHNLLTLAQYYYNTLSEFKESSFLKIANKIYVKDGFKLQKAYNDVIKQNFFSEVENIDFNKNEHAASTINSWVANNTNNLIKNLISPAVLNEASRLVLLNVIHFKAKWLHQFSKSLTTEKNFYIDETNFVKVQMMKTKQDFFYGYIQQLDAHALEMAYHDSHLAMLIILPNKRTGLHEVQQKLNTVSLKDIIKALDFTKVHVEFPKFKVEFQMELSETFKKLGMQRMFGSQAQFDKMLETKEQLQVSQIIHKAFIEVAEEGTEAAAATGMVFFLTSAMVEPSEPKTFQVEHPFHYIIHDTTNNVILFQGSIWNFQ